MTHSELVLTLVAALAAATLGARENVRLAPPPTGPGRAAVNVQAATSATVRTPARAKS